MPTLRELFNETPQSTTLSTSYGLNGNGKILISIIIGDIGQAGLSEAWLDDEQILNSIQGSFSHELETSNLTGRTLNIYSIVTDTSRASNYTEVGLHVTGGLSNFTNRLHKQVAQEGESVFYENEIFFF